MLLSESSTTRAIALESVTMRREPFSLVQQPIAWSADRRTRVMFFAMNLNLLSGETATDVTADAEDGARRIFPLRVEYVGKVPNYEWMSAIIVRLHDDMAESGDVLVRINLHGVASNRVRIGLGRVGGGPTDDAGSVSTPAPPAPPTPTPTPTPNPYTAPSSVADSVRFLEQSTFGATPDAIARIRQSNFRQFLNEQFNAPMSDYPELQPFPGDSSVGCPMGSPDGCYRDNYTMYPLQVRFFQNALTGQDQLRQRVAFALGQIFVVSGTEIGQPSSMAPYQRMLLRNSFGNFRQLMYDVTLNPAMGRYLDMVNNDKPNPSRGTEPNENYARELLQLFTVGLYQLKQDGTPQLDAQGQPVPTYDQDVIEGFAHVFTGWTYGLRPGATVMLQRNPEYYLVPMAAFENNHDRNPKRLLNGTILPGGQTAEQDLNAALDNIFNHPNVAPFISKRLIQHLVTSNPSPAYVARVSAVFNNNGAGVRGDLRAVVTAILLDREARGDAKTDPSYGHLREPALFVTNILRAFTASSDGILAGQPAGMGQNLFYSPSVFNYYSPLYQVPGTTILGPEFGIQNTATGLARSNFINTVVFSRINPPSDAPPGSTGTQINLQPMQALAGDPARLVGALDELLMHNSMSPVMRGVVTQAVTGIPASQPLQRAQTAVYLIATSFEFQVQR